MTLGAPLFLATLALMVPIVVTFLVKRQRRVLRVPSTMLWRVSAKAISKTRRFRDLRRLVALVLCLAAVTALGLAAARPGGSRADTSVYVVDVSASMSGEPMNDARRWLTRESASLGPGARIALITASAQPRVSLAPTAPGPLLDAAIAELQAEKETSALEPAIALGEALGGEGARVVVLSDQPLPSSASRRAFAHTFRRTKRDNLGIVALFTRAVPDARDDEEREAQIVVASSSMVTRRARLVVTLSGRVVGDRRIDVLPGTVSTERVGIRGGGRVVARVTAEDRLGDALDIDDEASLEEASRRAPRVVLVADEERSAAAFFVERALHAAGVVEIERITPDTRAPASAELAVVLADGRGRPREVPAFYVGVEPAELGFVTRAAREKEVRLRSVASEEGLMRGVSLDDVAIVRSKVAVAPPATSRSLIDLDGGPAFLAGGSGKHAWVWLGIDPEASDLVLRVAFPVLVGNVIAHLGGSAQVVNAPTVPRAEATLEESAVIDALPVAAEPRWRIPSSPPLLLAALAAALLILEAWLSLGRRSTGRMRVRA